MDASLLASEWLRAIRGRRSQRAASQRLGYGSNIVYRWEAGYCAPQASAAFRAAKRFGIDVDEAVRGFLGVPDAEQKSLPSVTTRPGVQYLLGRLRGDASFVELAERTPFNRFVLSRWFRGLTEPRLHELFELVEATTHRLLDFIAAFCDPRGLPSVAQAYEAHVALRNAAFDAPWSHAVLRALELADYARCAKHRPGWLAARIGISQKEEQRCLELLERSKQIEMRDGRWVVKAERTMDTGQDARRARELRRFWQAQALQRFDDGAPGAFGYNLFTISEKDHEALKALYVQYFENMRTLIANSSPGERLVLFCAQMVELDAGASAQGRRG